MRFYNPQESARAGTDKKRKTPVKLNTILLDIAEGVATVTLNRPERLNAFTGEMHGELREALARIKADGAVGSAANRTPT